MTLFDVIVILGAALTPDGLDLGDALAERVAEGAIAYKQGLAPKVIVTGEREAALMKKRLVELGVDPGAVLLEPTARTTRENALRSAELMRAHGMRRALIVTQPYHQFRAVLSFRKVGVDAHPWPMRDGWMAMRFRVRELAALLVYAARGWLY